MDPQERSELADQERVSVAVRDFYWRSHRLVDRLMTANGVSWARTRVLTDIARRGPLRSMDLATGFGVAPRTVTEAVDGLERDGLVRRDPDPRDRRAKRISLTEAGVTAAAASEASRIRYIQAVFGVLDPAECEDIVRLFAKLNERLETLTVETLAEERA